MKFFLFALLHLVLQPTFVVGGIHCIDFLGNDGNPWHDEYAMPSSNGEVFDCDFYGDDSYVDWCDVDGNLPGVDGWSANQACCVCGGGHKHNVPEGYELRDGLEVTLNDRIIKADTRFMFDLFEDLARICSMIAICEGFTSDGWLVSGWNYNGHQTILTKPQVSIGRPFVDKSGQQLSASADLRDTASWSADCPVHIDVERNNNTDSSMKALGTEWTRRALGEHASIASFAAFTVALMSNQAPPKLIADSLVAASDEYRHAQTSFEIASLLTGAPVEPQAIPPSSHEFGYNLAALALGTAEEGCIGETLSAIVAAYEVDNEIVDYDGINDDVKALLKDKVTTIVLEESRHAMLAWRTVAWVCSTDKEACEEVLEAKFSPEYLDSALHRHLGGEGKAKARSEGEKIFKTLIPYLMDKETDGLIDCSRMSDADGFDSKTAMVEQLSEMIIRGVTCT